MQVHLPDVHEWTKSASHTELIQTNLSNLVMIRNLRLIFFSSPWQQCKHRYKCNAQLNLAMSPTFYLGSNASNTNKTLCVNPVLITCGEQGRAGARTRGRREREQMVDPLPPNPWAQDGYKLMIDCVHTRIWSYVTVYVHTIPTTQLLACHRTLLQKRHKHIYIYIHICIYIHMRIWYIHACISMWQVIVLRMKYHWSKWNVPIFCAQQMLSMNFTQTRQIETLDQLHASQAKACYIG